VGIEGELNSGLDPVPLRRLDSRQENRGSDTVAVKVEPALKRQREHSVVPEDES